MVVFRSLCPINVIIVMNLGAMLANLGRMEESRMLQHKGLELDASILESLVDAEEETNPRE